MIAHWNMILMSRIDWICSQNMILLIDLIANFLNCISNCCVASVVKHKKGTYTHELQSSSQHHALCRGHSSGLPPTKPGDLTSPCLHLHRKILIKHPPAQISANDGKTWCCKTEKWWYVGWFWRLIKFLLSMHGCRSLTSGPWRKYGSRYFNVSFEHSGEGLLWDQTCKFTQMLWPNTFADVFHFKNKIQKIVSKITFKRTGLTHWSNITPRYLPFACQ